MRTLPTLTALMIVAASNGILAEPVINLRVNDAKRALVVQGDPLIASVSIVDYEAQTRNAEVVAGRMELDELRRKEAQGEVARAQVDARSAQLQREPPKETVIGTVRAPWHSQLIWQVQSGNDEWMPMTWSRMLMTIPATAATGSVGATDVLDAAFGFDPTVTAGIAPATYFVRVGYSSATIAVEKKKDAQPRQDTMWSNVVEVSLSRPDKKARRASYDALRFLARYWLHRGEPARALALAKDLQRQRPDDVNVIEIIGDAYVALGRPAAAREMYQRGINVYYARIPRPYEPPDLLIDKLNALSPPMLDKR